MSELLPEIIKSLIRSELKTELSNLSLSLSLTFKLRRLIFNKKKWGFNTLIEPLNEENNMLDKPEKRINHYRLIWQGMFKVQEETIRKIFSTCNTDTIAWQDLLAEEIQDNKERLYEIDKDTKESQDNM